MSASEALRKPQNSHHARSDCSVFQGYVMSLHSRILGFRLAGVPNSRHAFSVRVLLCPSKRSSRVVPTVGNRKPKCHP